MIDWGKEVTTRGYQSLILRKVVWCIYSCGRANYSPEFFVAVDFLIKFLFVIKSINMHAEIQSWEQNCLLEVCGSIECLIKSKTTYKE